ncbi:MAG: MFS transporter [Lachnospiraceae bacterium]|nr:MFS transporter [Lachnospiraceae bacterium]
MKLGYKHTLYASYLGYITQAIINNLAPLLFVTFQNQFEISLQQIGLLVSINFAIQMIVDVLAVKVIDKLGYRPCIVAAHVLATVGLVGMGIFPFVFPNAYLGLLTAVFLNAIGGGLLEVLVSPIVEALPGDQKESAMSLLHSFYCWGHVGVVLLSTLYFVTIGIEYWYFLPMLWAILPLFNIFFFSKVPIRTLEEDCESMPLKKLFSIKLFWLFFVMMICSGASEQAMSQWASLFAETGLKVSKTMGDLLGPCAFAVLMGLSRLLYGKFGDRIPLKNFIAGSSLLCIISYLIASLSPNPLLALIGCALCGFSVGIMWPGTFSLGAKYCPQGGTAMFALFALAGDVGCSAGPGVVSLIADQGLQKGILLAIVFPICMLCAVLVLGRSKRAAKE